MSFLTLVSVNEVRRVWDDYVVFAQDLHARSSLSTLRLDMESCSWQLR